MSGFDQHLHVPNDPHFQSPASRRPRPRSPHDIDQGLESLFHFSSPTRRPSLREIDIANGVQRSPSPTALLQQPIMATAEQQIQQLRELAEAQNQQIREQQRQNSLIP